MTTSGHDNERSSLLIHGFETAEYAASQGNALAKRDYSAAASGGCLPAQRRDNDEQLIADTQEHPSSVDKELSVSGRDASTVMENNAGSGTHSSQRKLVQEILSLALPALISLAVDPLMSAVDTIYIGRLGGEFGGEIGLGALGLNTYIFSFAFSVFVFLATVPTPLVASARAQGDDEGAARLIGQLLTTALALGMTLLIILEIAGPWLLSIMGATSANYDEALSYLRARAIAAPAVLTMSVGNGAFRGFLDTRTPLLIAVGATLVNFVLDPLLIFTAGMGVQGAAIATVTAEWCGALTFLYLLAGKAPTVRPQRITLPSTQEGWDQGLLVLTSAAAVFSRTIALQAALSVASAFAARVGPAGIAAHQVASQLWIILSYAYDSLAVAAQGLIADRLGSGWVVAARDVATLVLQMAVGFGVLLLIIFQLFGGMLPRIFTGDTHVLAVVAPVIALIGILQPINAYVYVGDGVLQGSQDFVYEALTMVLSAAVSVSYVLWCWYATGDMQLMDVWIGLSVLQGSRAITFSFRHWLDRNGPLVNKCKDQVSSAAKPARLTDPQDADEEKQ